MNKTHALYLFGILAAALAVAFPSITWISLVAFLVILPLGAIWIGKSDGRPIGGLGFGLSSGWLRYLALGLLFGLGIPLLFLSIQQLGGWITLAPRGEPILNLITYLPPLFIRMVLIVVIEEFVFRGFFPNALSQNAGIWTAMVMSSLLWGASHLGSMVYEGLAPGSMVIGMASFLAWGITLSLCYLIAEKSLWFPCGLHLGVNLSFSLAGWFFITETSAPQWWIGHPAWSPESGLIGPIIWLIIGFTAYRLAGAKKVAKVAAY